MNITDKNGVKRSKDEKGRFCASDYTMKYLSRDKIDVRDPFNKSIAIVDSRKEAEEEIQADLEQYEKAEQISTNMKAASKAKFAEFDNSEKHLSKRSEEEVQNDLAEAKWHVDAYKSGVLKDNPYVSNGSLSYWESKVDQLKKELGEVHKRKGFEQKKSWNK